MPREQEFSHRVIYTAALAANGKLSLDEAYNNIKLIWKQLKRSKKQLGIGQDSSVENDE